MGRSKAWLPFGPERMLQRVVRLVGTVARPIVVVAAPDQELPDLSADIAIVRDPIAGRGPLQGLAAGFAALPDSVDLVYATATDVPFLEPRWIIRLAELIGDHDLAIPFIGEHYHPLAALYRKDVVLPVIERLLSEDRLRLRRRRCGQDAGRARGGVARRRPEARDTPEPQRSCGLSGSTSRRRLERQIDPGHLAFKTRSHTSRR